MRWKKRPKGSNWGDFGPDDRFGRLNLITPERVRAAASEVREGLSFCLSLPLDFPGGSALNPRRFPPQISYSMRGEDPVMVYPMEQLVPGQTDVVCDDQVMISTQYSTQWDALAHFGAKFDANDDGIEEIVFYNGYRAGTDIRGPRDYITGAELPPPYGAGPLGIDGLAETCLQGRGVMIDLFAHFGTERRAVGYSDIEHVMKADGITIEEGDILCLRTGFDRLLMSHGRAPPEGVAEQFCAGLDGSDQELLNWIDKSGIAAIAADTYAVEFLPSKSKPSGRGTHVPLHEHCLFKLGIPLGEMFLMSDLADWLGNNGRSRFLMTAPPLRLPGAVGSPVTPVATV